jgi:DNA-binding response OmpR family regulator
MNPGSGVLSGRRILIVEDEAIVSLMLEDLLTESGCIVIGPTGTTTAALALIEHESIDCAVLDVKLTDGMSVPVAEALAARGIRFVIATGWDRESIPPAYNGAPVLSKVFMPDQLIEAIADILRL